MKTTRFLKARSVRYAVTAALVLSASPLFAQNSAQEPASSIISFQESDGLRSTNAATILSERLHLRAGTDELRSVYNERPGDGLEVQRFHQYFKGLKVAHGSYTLTSKNGVAAYAFGKYYEIAAATTTTASLNEADALDNALKATGAAKYAWQATGAAAPKGQLQFVEDFTYGQPDGLARLAYAFDIAATEPLSREMVYVDAQSGKILFRDAILKHIAATAPSIYSGTLSFEAQLSGSNYILADATRGNGVFTYTLNNTTPPGNGGGTGSFANVTSATTTFTKDAAIDAHWGAEMVYDYWKTKRNRNSWDGANGVLKSYVHYGNNYINAFWDGGAMNYGDGSSGYGAFTALDVCGHEIGHGVCQSTAALVYSGESGGMNEGFSDIWGATIEAFADPHEVDAIAKN